MNAPEQAIKIYRGDDTDWNGETLLNFTVTADFDISDFTAEFLLGGISKNNISLADGGSFEVNFSHEETAQMPWGLNKGILKIFDADKRIKTVTNDILFWVTNEPVGEQTESIIVPVPETSPVQITLQIGGGSSGGGAWGSITGNIENQADLQEEFATKMDKSGGTFTGDITLAEGVSLKTQVGEIHDVNDNIVVGGKDTNYGLYVAPDGTAAALVGNNSLKDIITTADVKSTYSASGTDPVNGVAVASALNPINAVIPSQATEENKLADKNFVNSSVSTNTAYFIGTFESVEELEAYSGTVTNNDYAFVVGTDSDGNTVYNRYKYTTATTPASWLFEYALNNSSFTAAQWASIQSGITSADVTQIGTNTTNIAAKQPKTLETPLTVDGTQQTTVEGALGAVNTLAGKGIANKATGTNSLSILGNATSNSYATNIGSNSSAEANYTLSVGYGAKARGKNSTCVGPISNDNYNTYCTLVGNNAQSESNYGIAIGASTKAAAVGAIQIGNTTTALITNSNSKTLQVFEYQLLDGNTGKIPAERLDNALPSQTDQSGKFLTTDGTSASWADAPTGLNAVYEDATETLFFTSGSPEPPLLSHYTFDGSGNLVDCDDKVFLGATGTQYINTGISNSNNNTLNINYKFEANDRPTICGIFGGTGYATNSVTTLSGYTQYAILKTNARVNINFATGSHSLIVSPSNVTYDDSTISWTSDTGNGLSGQICLFTSRWGSTQEYGILKLNRFKIYDSSNVLMRDFIPVKEGMEIGNQTIASNGMWDAVNQTFYGNLGVGVFDFHIEE